jgi:hypothetical protein
MVNDHGQDAKGASSVVGCPHGLPIHHKYTVTAGTSTSFITR